MVGPIVLFGATGVFGQLIAEDLLSHTDAPLVLASRRPASLEPLAAAHPARLRLLAADVNDPADVREALRSAAACILAVGPFQNVTPAALDACIERGVPCIDINDSRAYAREVYRREEAIRRAGIPVLTGLSTMPGTTSLCVSHAVACLRQGARAGCAAAVDAIQVALFMGNRNVKGVGAVSSLLSSIGEPFEAVRDGAPFRARVWGGRAAVRFLPPVGVRVVRDFETPDYDLLPRQFGARTVSFKCGFDLDGINRGLEACALLRRVAGFRGDRWARALIAASRITQNLGAGVGALRVEVMSKVQGPGSGSGMTLDPGPRTAIVQVTAFERGQRVAAIPAAVGARHLWEGKLTRSGILPMYEWIAPEAFFAELRGRGFRVEMTGWER